MSIRRQKGGGGGVESAGGADWYPSLRGKSAEALAQMDGDMASEERWPWKRDRGKWRRMAADGSVADDSEQLVPGTAEHLSWTLRVGYQVHRPGPCPSP